MPRDPLLLHSDVHLPRWKRAVIWLLEDDFGRGLFAVLALGILAAPYLLFGKWWFAILGGFVVGWAVGFSCARWEWLKTGKVQRL